MLAGLAAVLVIVSANPHVAGIEKTPGELLSFLFYAALLKRPVGTLSNVYGKWQMAKGTLNRLDEVLHLKEEPGFEVSVQLENVEGAITFDNVDITYF